MQKYFFTILLLSFIKIGFAQSFQEVAFSEGVTGSCGFCHFGAGLSFMDFNGDGLDDLTFATASGYNVKFYQNNGAGFTEITAPITNTGDNKAIIWVDFDNDGDNDLYVTNFADQNRLYENDGSLNLTDITATAGLPLINDETFGATWGDYNGDGFLDLYVSNYTSATSYQNFLFRNNGDGTFTDVSVLTNTQENGKPSFCSAFFDINNDTKQDLYISSDRTNFQNALFKNEGNGTLSDISASSNSNIAIDAMNTGIGDYNEDGFLDIYVTNTASGNKLLQNNGNETFNEVARTVGVELKKTSWGGNFFDADNDLDLDLYVSVMHQGPLYASELFINDLNTGTFTPLPEADMPGDTLSSQANAIGDFNNDGKLDIAVNSSLHGANTTTSRFSLWKNTSTNMNHWIKVYLNGLTSNLTGIGSRVEFYVNGQIYTRYVHCGISYLAQNASGILFGMGTNNGVDSIKVYWPSGATSTVQHISQGSTVSILEDLSTLPISWTSVDAKPTKRHTILVKWSTGFEQNNKGFSLQRSDDGIFFHEVKWIDGNGNSLNQNNYSYEDSDLLNNSTYYYQIVQYDYDGKSHNSRIVKAIVKSNTLSVGEFYPNPINDGNIKIKLSATHPTKISISVQGTLKKQVFFQQTEVAPGSTTLTLNLPKLPPGMYFAQIKTSDENSWIRKFVVE